MADLDLDSSPMDTSTSVANGVVKSREKKEKKEKKDKKEKKEKKEKKHRNDTEVDGEKKEKKSKRRLEESAEEEKQENEKPMMNGINHHHDHHDHRHHQEEERNGRIHKKQKTSDTSSSSTSSSSSSLLLPSMNGVDKSDAAGNPPLSDFNIHASTLALLYKKNITHAFPIQAATFNQIINGEDVVGRAFTGTGKTLAFALPICERLQTVDEKSGDRLKVGRGPRVIVLTPTRELAKQVSETFELVGPRLSHTCVYGGSPYPPMEAALRRGVDVVVGTCGRIQDLIERKSLQLSSIQVIIMDEADEMLNMGFADDVEKILESAPRNQQTIQTLLFSATLPSWVQQVASKYLRSTHRKIDLTSNLTQKTTSDVLHYAIACHWAERNNILKSVINVHGGGETARTIVFTETKKEANEIALASSISSMCGVLHGDIAQSQRETTLKGFREGKFSVLIATDVAARGIDIAGVELVIQIEPPQSVETYIHRSGRTGRAGSKGVAVTFYTSKQLYWLNQIERIAKIKFVKVGVPQRDDIYALAAAAAVKQISSVHKDVIPHFLTAARTLLESHAFTPSPASNSSRISSSSSSSSSVSSAESESETESDGEHSTGPDPVYVLAAALAKVSGHAEPLQARSLLMSVAGWTTVHFTSPMEIRSLSFVWNAIRRWLFTSETESNEKVKGMRLTLDRHGAVFDIPVAEENRLKQVQLTMADPKNRERNRFEICKSLPPLPQQEAVRPEMRRWGGRSRDGSSSGGRSSSGSSRGGGAGRGGGRGGFRGRR